MKQKQVTFVLMLMSIFLSCVFNVKAQIPSFEEYDWDVFEEYEQTQDVFFIFDKYYPENDNLSDYARTKKAIADAFKDWQQRGEFETSADYEERLKNESLIKFYNLCLAYTRYTLRQYEWTFVPIKYDIDKQEYTLELYKRKDERVDFDGDFFTAKVTIAPSDARHLKQVFETAYENSVTPFAFSLFTYYPLQCVANGKFIPTYLIFSTEAFYFEIDNSKYPGAKEITYSAAELGINNKYLAGKKCQMNEVWKILINKKLAKEDAGKRAKNRDWLQKEERTEQNPQIHKQDILQCLPNDNIIQHALRTPYVKTEYKVYDYADALSEEEEDAIRKRINTMIEESNLDAAVVFISESDWTDDDNEDFIKDFYDYNDFGVGNLHDGVCIVINMATRRFAIFDTGNPTQHKIAGTNLEKYAKIIQPYFRNNNYSGGVMNFLKEFEKDCNEQQ